MYILIYLYTVNNVLWPIKYLFLYYYHNMLRHSWLLLELFYLYLKSASNLNGNLNCSKELEHYAS